MWPLVRADFQYTRIGLGIIALLAAFFFYQHAAHDGWGFYTFVSNTASTAMITMGIMAGATDKEKRDRTMMTLPVPIGKVGLARLIYVPIVLVGLMAVWSVYLLVRPQGGSMMDVWIMFNAIALSFIVFMIFAIHHDLAYHDARRHRMWMYAAIVVVLVVIAVAALNDQLEEWGLAYGSFLRSFVGVVVHFAVAGVMLVLQLRAFAHRRSYLS